MQIKAYPNCCTTKVLVGFGETDTSDWEIRPDNAYTVEDIKKSLGKVLNLKRSRGMATVSCITNNEQLAANQALEECGFLSSDWMSKSNHPETMIKLWWFPLNEKQVNG